MKEELPTRSICRFLAILKVINRLGPVSLLTIAREIDVPYPTVSRVIHTLLESELIERVGQTKLYRPTGKTLSLSSGFAEHDGLAMIARPHMVALTAKIGWPLALATRVGPSMVVRESTHHLTSLALSRCPNGFQVPLLESAAGHVHLSYASDAERECVLAGLELVDGLSPMMVLFKSGAPLARIREDGFATYERGQHSLDPGKISSIAVPLLDRKRLVGVLTLMLFASAMPIAEGLRRYLRDLQAVAHDVSAQFAAGIPFDEASTPVSSARTPARTAVRKSVRSVPSPIDRPALVMDRALGLTTSAPRVAVPKQPQQLGR